MSITFKDKRPISIRTLCVGVLALAISWLIVVVLLAKMPTHQLPETLLHCLTLIAETLFIGAVVAFIADRYLKQVFDESDAEQLARMGIHVHSSRQEASADMLKCVQDAHEIDIAGISLRDFLLPSGKDRDVWDAIVRRLAKEQEQQLPKPKRLSVRLLLLDPRSSEGLFRHDLERASIGKNGLPYDVPRGLEEVAVVQEKVYGTTAQEFLQVRLYHHCSFAFQFLTNDTVLIEQYYYKDHTHHVHVPLLQYTRGDRHREFRESFEKMWKAARKEGLDDSYVGTDNAIESALIRNIYRGPQRIALGLRQQQVLDSVKTGDIVKILAITGKYYISHPILQRLRDASERGVSVRFALLNPVCSQSILRAVADSCPPSDIMPLLGSWDWQKQRDSDLYQDIKRAMRHLLEWQKAGASFDVHLHHSAISCALFLTPDHGFVEQYLYGRSQVFEKGRVLGGEYPVFEFGTVADDGTKCETAEQQMLAASFDVVWDSFSIPAVRYLEKPEEEEKHFEQSMEDIWRWFNLRSRQESERQTMGHGASKS